ncbi:pimeloyl-ACP methyl ester carboxylesterase [Actinocorallia herbida]|uniref:Pimeloyl-ACP methyl ester carboxylesterase n=1 Tax=Actinocorallia herbida TaxID=58109 RepID=A0A3N1CSF9_9ACTN|nr:alpha/beta hydrolase [Actinocorallia herbida]ROO84266.1 pimeloyl-ACP methyl ester carboxylesterase [Actinocorallia herbida]
MTVRSAHRSRRTFGVLFTAVTLAVGLGVAAAPSTAKPGGTPAAPKPTIVLVHGVFADASGWNSVIAKLQAQGFPVIAPANPLRTLEGDSDYVSSVVDSLAGPVIMVGHSYGGAVITNAARGHENVEALVYVAAFAPDEGESPLGLATGFPGGELGGALLIRDFPGGGKDGYIDPAKFRAVFGADLPASTTRLMAATQRPGSVEGLSGLSGVPAWATLPSWYVIPTEDKVIPADAQRFMAERAGSKVLEVKGASHAVLMSRPDTVLRQILAAYTATR